jgi:hypothetical protein
MKSLPGRLANYLFPSVEDFKKKFEMVDEDAEREIDSDGGRLKQGGEGEEEEEGEEEDEAAAALKKKHLSNDDDLFLMQSGLTSSQIE